MVAQIQKIIPQINIMELKVTNHKDIIKQHDYITYLDFDERLIGEVAKSDGKQGSSARLLQRPRTQWPQVQLDHARVPPKDHRERDRPYIHKPAYLPA
jgi:hypothetical protein